jgi:hypothetical protein
MVGIGHGAREEILLPGVFSLVPYILTLKRSMFVLVLIEKEIYAFLLLTGKHFKRIP